MLLNHRFTIRIYLIIVGFLYPWFLYSQEGNFCTPEPELRIGLIADPQYCDCDNSGVRLYRKTLKKLPSAIDTLNKYQVDFVMTLGDLIDKYSESYDSVLQFYQNLTMPYYNLLGNHQFEEISEPDGASILNQNQMPWYYYDFSYEKWRFLVLDGTELAAYSRFIHPELALEGDSLWNSVQGNINDLPWNGGISLNQQLWMRERIDDAVDNHQNVILFCHFPVYPENIDLFLWNNREIITLLEEYPNITAFVNGHYHQGTYGLNNGIHYYTQKAMLDTDENSFSIMEIYHNEIKIKGYGNITDTSLLYDNFIEKKIPFHLADTVIHYSQYQNNFISKLSADTQLNFTPSYFIDTAFFLNRFFRISNDTLFLNTVTDLSVYPEIKLKITSGVCDYDTTIQDFYLSFDTSIAAFNYLTGDTLISVYDTFLVNIDSLIHDYSRNGLNFTLLSSDTTIVIPVIVPARFEFIPKKTGKSNITLIASDAFTGKSILQRFEIEVNDPLNHAPKKKPAVFETFIIQLHDSLFIGLDELFEDEDNDILQMECYVQDTTQFRLTQFSDGILIIGSEAGSGNVIISVDDQRGGTDTLNLSLIINSDPLLFNSTNEFYFSSWDTSLIVNMDSVFYDTTGDSLFYSVDFISSPQILYSLSGSILSITPNSIDTLFLTISAYDQFGGTNNTEIRLLPLFHVSFLTLKNSVPGFQIYPNPSRGAFYISFSNIDYSNFKIKVVDITGKNIFDSQLYSVVTGINSVNISLDDAIENGIYFCKLYLNYRLVNVQKLTIQKKQK